MKHVYKIILICWMFLSLNAASQLHPPVIEWQKSLGGSKVDKANTVIRTLDNGFLVAGYSFSNDGQVTGHHGSTDSADAWVVRLDHLGNIVWQRSYGGTNADNLEHALALSNGDFILVGYSQSNNGDVSGLHGTEADLWAMRIDMNGNIIWSRLYGGTDRDIGQVVRHALDGGYIIGGSAESGDGDITNHIGWSDVWLLKINDNGVIQWQKKYGNLNHQYTYDLLVTADGNYAVTGSQQHKGLPTCIGSPMYAYSQQFALKVDRNGTLLWERYSTFACGNPGSTSYSTSIHQMPGGQYLNIGFDYTATSATLPALRLDRVEPATGQHRIVRTSTSLPGFNNLSEQFNILPPGTSELLLDSSLITVLTRWVSGSRNGTLTRISTREVSGSMPILYRHEYGGTNNDEFMSIAVINDLEYTTAGFSNSNNGDVSGNHGDYDFWVVKFSTLNKITGKVYIDNNGNGVRDAGENYFTNLRVSSAKGLKTIASATNANGLFLNNADTGTYLSTVELLKPYFNPNPASKSSLFTSYNGKDSFDFALVPIPNKRDLRVTVNSTSPIRPGFEATYSLSYVNEGTEVINNVIVKLLLPSNMDFVSSVPAHSAYANDTVTWNIGTVAPLAGATISIRLKADPPPALNIGEVPQVIAVAEPVAGDETPLDNRDSSRRRVIGSYDPNDKSENLDGTLLPEQLGQKYLTYTIRFQNTGNDTAFNVIVRDTLDAKLDWSTIEMVNASHNFHLSIKDGNNLAWTFTNILLPDSNTNEPLSHGHITYRIKSKSTLAIGDVIRNSASIYFDFNLPVKTNTTQTTVRPVTVAQPSVSGIAASYCSTQGTQQGKINNLPASGSGITVTVKLNGNNLAVAADSTFSFDVSALAAGAHVIDVTYTTGTETKTSTINFNVTAAVSPDVNVSANNTNVANLLDPVTITASNVAGGGTTPLYTFGKDRSFTNLWQAEGSSNVLNLTGANLQSGDNWIYVRMKTSATCYTTQFNIDSIKIVLQLPVPNQPVITGVKTSYCANEGIQKAKLSNYPAAGTGTTVTVKLDGNVLSLNMVDTSFTFDVAAGNHVAEATYTNSTGTKTTTANFTVTAAVAPDFDITGFTSQIVSTFPITTGAVNITGGGTAPTFTFALDRNFTNILQAEGTKTSITFDPSVLKLGANKLYVRMKTSATCYTQQIVIDSVTLTKYGASGIIDPDYPTQRISANPNPFKSRLLVHGINAAKAYMFTIHNQQGRKVFERRIANAASATVHLPALPAGIYTLSIFDETKDRLIGTINIAKQ